MGDNFIRLKKTIKRDTLIKAGALGISSGLAVASAIALVNKLTTVTPNLPVLILVGLAVAFASAGVYLLFTFPTDRRIARRLDSKLALNEKAQTMVEFAHSSGDMIALQRKDTDERLGGVTLKSLGKDTLYRYLIALAVAVALLVAAIAVPVFEEAPPPDPDFNMDSWQETSLENLITYVRSSSMTDSAKNATVKELEDLLAELKTVGKVSEMKASVIDAIVAIDAATDAVNSYHAIRAKMDAADDDSVKLFASSAGALGSTALPDAFDELKAQLAYASFATVAPDFTAKARAVLLESGYNGDDMLYSAMTALFDKLDLISEGISEHTEQTFNTALDASFATAASEINAALRQQNVNTDVCDYTVLKLIEIFEIPLSDIPDLGANDVPGESDNNGGDSENDDNNPSTDGGLGSGDAIYGSDDLIYDPDTNSYVTYGEVLNKYYAKIAELLLDGTLTEEEIEAVNEYFATLYDGSKKE